MSTPSNPIVRAVAAVASGGLTEVPAQYKGATAAITGKDPIKAFGEAGSPVDVIMPKPPAAPSLTMSPSANYAGPDSSPAASLRARRNFSTILTSSQGVSDNAPVQKKTLLGGFPTTLGR